MSRYMSRARRFDQASRKFEGAKTTAVDKLDDVIRGLGTNDLTVEEAARQADEIVSDYESDRQDAASDIESIKEEITSWKENIEEKFSSTQKYSDLEDCESELETAYDDVDSASVSFDAEQKYTSEELQDAVQELIDELEGFEINGSPSFPGMFS